MTRACEHCGGDFDARNGTARFCTDRCRKAHKRHGGPRPSLRPVPTPPPAADDGDNPEHGPMARVAWRDLSAAGLVHDIVGVMALVLARAIDNGPHTGASLSALTREFSRVWSDVRTVTEPADDNPLAGLRRRRRDDFDAVADLRQRRRDRGAT